MANRRSSGQSTIGGSDAVAGKPSRTAAVGARSRRCTTALVKCVVPIITASTASAFVRDASQHLFERVDDAPQYIRCGRRLDGGEHVGPVHDHGIGVGTADVDADADHCLELDETGRRITV